MGMSDQERSRAQDAVLEQEAYLARAASFWLAPVRALEETARGLILTALLVLFAVTAGPTYVLFYLLTPTPDRQVELQERARYIEDTPMSPVSPKMVDALMLVQYPGRANTNYQSPAFLGDVWYNRHTAYFNAMDARAVYSQQHLREALQELKGSDKINWPLLPEVRIVVVAERREIIGMCLVDECLPEDLHPVFTSKWEDFYKPIPRVTQNQQRVLNIFHQFETQAFWFEVARMNGVQESKIENYRLDNKIFLDRLPH